MDNQEDQLLHQLKILLIGILVFLMLLWIAIK
jgi:hypothetical protein